MHRTAELAAKASSDLASLAINVRAQERRFAILVGLNCDPCPNMYLESSELEMKTHRYHHILTFRNDVIFADRGLNLVLYEPMQLDRLR